MPGEECKEWDQMRQTARKESRDRKESLKLEGQRREKAKGTARTGEEKKGERGAQWKARRSEEKMEEAQ